jgi:hypothetical protein
VLRAPQVRAAFEQLREPHWLVQDAAQPVEQIHEQVRRRRGKEELCSFPHSCLCGGLLALAPTRTRNNTHMPPRHPQVLAEALETIKRCQEAQPLRQLWDYQPLVLQPPTAAATAGEATKAATAAAGATASPAGARQQPLQERPQQAC